MPSKRRPTAGKTPKPGGRFDRASIYALPDAPDARLTVYVSGKRHVYTVSASRHTLTRVR